MREVRWNCETQGCFRCLCPRLGEFDGCFPEKIGMSDVDGVVDVRGRVLFMEWKANGGVLEDAQRYLFRTLTSICPDECRVVAIVVWGHPETMDVWQVQVFKAGRESDVEPCDLDGLKIRLKAWGDRAWERFLRLRGAP